MPSAIVTIVPFLSPEYSYRVLLVSCEASIAASKSSTVATGAGFEFSVIVFIPPEAAGAGIGSATFIGPVD